MVKSSFLSPSFRIAAILAVISSGFAASSAFAADRKPPTTEAFIQWTASTDDGLHLFYSVFVNGVEVADARQSLFAVVHGLTPETTYDITVKARDLYAGNFSTPSNVLSVTTAAVITEDSEPPTVPPVSSAMWSTTGPAKSICSGRSRSTTRRLKRRSCMRFT